MRQRAIVGVSLFVVCLVFWMGRSGTALGQEASPNASTNAIPPANEESIQAWLGELSSPNFQARRQAFIRLWEQGKLALPAVRSAAQASDRQIAGAAKVLEMLLRLEILPQNNDELGELLQLARVPRQQAVLALVARGQWKLAAEFLKSAEPDRNVYRQGANLWLCSVAQTALEQGDPLKAWPIVQLNLSPVHRAWLSQKMHLPLDHISLNRDDRALGLMFRGQFQEAVAQQPSIEVMQRIVFLSGNWELLQSQPLRSHILGSENETLQSRAQRAAFAYLTNDLKTSDRLVREVLEQLKSNAEQKTPGDPGPAGPRESFGAEGSEGFDMRTQTVMVSLLICGQGELVKEFMTSEKVRENIRYFESDLDYERILDAFELNDDLSNFDTWLDQTIADLRPNLKNAISARGLEQYRHLCELSSAMVAMGKVEYAMRLYQRLMEVTRDAPAQYRDNIWNYFTRQTRLSYFRPHAIRLLDHSGVDIGDEARERMFAILYPEWGIVASALWKSAPPEFVMTNSGEEGAGSTARRVQRWSAMERLWRQDRQMLREEPAALENWLKTAHREASRMEETAAIASGQLSRLAMNLGLRELALTFANSGKGSSALGDVAEVYAQNNALPQAIRWWDAAIDRDPRDHLKILRNIEAKQIVGEDESAEQLERSRWLRPLDVDRLQFSYMSVAEDLFEEGKFEQSRDYAQAAFAVSDLRVSSLFGAKRYATVLNELEDFKGSADANRVANTILLMEPNIGVPLAWIQHAISEEFLTRALADLKENNVEAALDRIARFERIRPAGIEICEHAYTRLVNCGRKDAADNLLERCRNRMLVHLEKWPNDAGAHNNYAWMLARCDQRLEESLSHAKLAVELSDGLPTYVDTLAEVQFRLGQVDLAIDLAQRCIALDPRHSHYRKQLVRFRDEKKKRT